MVTPSFFSIYFWGLSLVFTKGTDVFMTVSDFYKSIFGEKKVPSGEYVSPKVYKISLDAGCTCPNRDGTCGTGGCTFCGESGSGEFAERGENIAAQVEKAKVRVQGKIKPGVRAKYVVYFQNFTNTYGPLEVLSEKWETAVASPEVVGLALGTRPDCLSEECISYLARLSEKTFVQLELGFQTCNEETAAFFNRGYSNQIYQDAVSRIRKLAPKIHIVTHIMFGLPVREGVMETPEQMLSSVKFALEAGTHGIKITNLYIIKNTKMADLYEHGKVKVLEREEYLSLLEAAVKIIPPEIVIHRLTGDPAKKDLIAPLWCTDKKRMINALNSTIINSWQKNE